MFGLWVIGHGLNTNNKESIKGSCSGYAVINGEYHKSRLMNERDGDQSRILLLNSVEIH